MFSFFKGDCIAVHLTKFFFSKFTEFLEEGKVFVISNFCLSPNRGCFKTTVHPYRIKFQEKTVVEPVEDDPAISLYGFKFIPFTNICTRIHDEDVLVGEFLTLLINFKNYAFYLDVVLTYSLFLNRCYRFADMQDRCQSFYQWRKTLPVYWNWTYRFWVSLFLVTLLKTIIIVENFFMFFYCFSFV